MLDLQLPVALKQHVKDRASVTAGSVMHQQQNRSSGPTPLESCSRSSSSKFHFMRVALLLLITGEADTHEHRF